MLAKELLRIMMSLAQTKPPVDEVTERRLAYLRLHGRDAHAYTTGKTVAERFDYNYNDRELDEIMRRVFDMNRQADDVHVLSNNNRADYAPRAAERLRRKLGQPVAVPTKLSQGE